MTVTLPGAGRSPSPRAAALALLVLLASGAVGFWAYHRMHRQGSIYAAGQPTTPAPALTAGPSAAAPQSADMPVVHRKPPEQLPQLALPDTQGRQHHLSEWAGRPLMVNFWATWCEPCQREIPLLKELRREHAAIGLEIVGIALDSADEVSKYAAAHGIGYPILVGERGGLEAAAAFGMETVLPFTAFADRQGRILGLKVGELHRDEADLILGLVGKVDDDKLTPEAARQQIADSLPRLARARTGSGGSGEGSTQ